MNLFIELEYIRYKPEHYLDAPGLQSLVDYIYKHLWNGKYCRQSSHDFWLFTRWSIIAIPDASVSFPFNALLKKFDSETAFREWYQYLDLFRACSESVIGNHRGPFETNSRIDTTITRIPAALQLIQFIPSQVYTTRTTCTCNEAIYYGWTADIERTKIAAQNRWNADPKNWIKVEN